MSFLATLAALAAREIIAGRNWRNLRVLALVAVLIAGNVVFHLEIMWSGSADYGIRIGVAAIVALLSLVGGRIIPSFTRNWLVRERSRRLPTPFSRYDVVTLAARVLSLALWIALPASPVTGIALIAAALVQAVRLLRWAGDRTLADRLVLVLHVAYAFVPIGFALLGASTLWGAVPRSVGMHAWTAGAIGLMTLAVMTRASLGHTRQALVASAGTQAIYALAACAAVLRIAAALDGSMTLTCLAGLAWVAAFGGFAILYGPLLWRHEPVWAARR